MTALPGPTVLRQPAAAARALADVLHLKPGRAHEICGPARRTLAIWAMQDCTEDATLWIRPRWSPDRLHPQAVADWVNPAGLITLDAARDSESLGCAEDALRSGALALVVIELTSPPALTPLRRLHLAAEAGLARRQARDQGARVLALVLTPEEGGTPGVESRWHLVPCEPGAMADHGQAAPAWVLRRLRARMAPPAAWQVTAKLQASPCLFAQGAGQGSGMTRISGLGQDHGDMKEQSI
ncbi:MAG: ImuA family protein [Roseinatronobacter sp.]